MLRFSPPPPISDQFIQYSHNHFSVVQGKMKANQVIPIPAKGSAVPIKLGNNFNSAFQKLKVNMLN